MRHVCHQGSWPPWFSDPHQCLHGLYPSSHGQSHVGSFHGLSRVEINAVTEFELGSGIFLKRPFLHGTLDETTIPVDLIHKLFAGLVYDVVQALTEIKKGSKWPELAMALADHWENPGSLLKGWNVGKPCLWKAFNASPVDYAHGHALRCQACDHGQIE